MRTLDELLDEAHQLIGTAENAEGWDLDTIDTANHGALLCFQEIDQRLRDGEPYPQVWQTGR